jgi:class 3 adenylate cyclase
MEIDSDAGYLIINPDREDSFKFELTDCSVFAIGRLPANGDKCRLVLNQPEVSGHHAELKQSHYGWTLRDTGSTNGTRLNGNWITPGQEYLLKDDDLIQIAEIKLLVKLNKNQNMPKKDTVADGHEKTRFQVKKINATILVGDFRSFTALLEDYSDTPDLVMQATQKVFKAMNEIIFQHHGQIEKIAGDAVMAYWHSEIEQLDKGKFSAYEACLSAIKLKRLIADCGGNPEYWPFKKHKLCFDIAIATGPVASGVSGEVRANPHLLGDTANLAFRLEKLIAEDRAGDIIMDGSTYKLVEDLFTTESLGKVSVKGRQKLVDLYRLLDSVSV